MATAVTAQPTGFFATVVADIKAVWGDIETEGETLATEVWDDFKTAFLAVLPQEYALLKTAIANIIGDGFSGDIAGIEVELLNLGGETLELVKKLGSAVTQALIGTVAASTPAIAAAVAPKSAA